MYLSVKLARILCAILLTLLSCLSVVSHAYALSANTVSPWSTSSNSLTQGLNGLTSVTNNGYIYVMGGNSSGGASAAVYYAPINSNGSVGSWTTSSNSLPQALFGATSVVSGGYIYVVGGTTGLSMSSAVYSAPINSNGSVGSWTTQAHSLPQTEYYATSITYNGYIYVIAGTGSGIPDYVNTVYSAQLTSGTVSSWTTSGNTLPTALSGTTAVTNNGYVYVIGGQNNSSSQVATVYYAQLNSGSVGSWTTSSNSLPVAEDGMTASTYGGYVYIAGGQNASSVNVNTVYSAPLNSNGTVGSWTTSSNSLPSTPFLLTSVAYNDYFYVLGGYNSGSPQSSVYFANLSGAAYPGVSSKTTTVSTDSSTTVNVLSGVSGDPDSASLQIVSGPTHGAAVDPPGSITYTPNKGYSGTDSLVYQVCSLDDESLCSQAILTFDVSAATPDTGYGRPAQSNPLVALLILGATASTAMGLRLLYRQKQKSRIH